MLGVSESGYYDWKDRPAPPRTLRRIWLAGEIADVHKAASGTYGEMRVTAELRYGRNIIVGHNAVGSIMRELGLKGLPTRRLSKGARVAQVTSLDLVRRESRRDGAKPAMDDRHHITDAGLAPSMGAVGSAYDNAIMHCQDIAFDDARTTGIRTQCSR